MRYFEAVEEEYRKSTEKGEVILLPEKGTKHSAGYDFFAPKEFTAKAGRVTRIWSDVRVKMEEDETLILVSKSSLVYKYGLLSTGIIDADYYNNKETGGNVGLLIINEGIEDVKFQRGEKVLQGIFMKILNSKNGNTEEDREGGFGSTGK